jgi:hypothetical protein
MTTVARSAAASGAIAATSGPNSRSCTSATRSASAIMYRSSFST